MSILNCACGKAIVAQPEWAGRTVRCPGCGAEVQVPADAQVVATAAEANRACPFCQEQISVAAAKCRFCGEFVNAPRPAGRAPSTPQDTGGVGILIMGILSVVLCQLLGPIAWVMGSSHETKCRQAGMQPAGIATAGKILGIVGTVLLGIAVILCVLVIPSAGAVASSGNFRPQ